MPVNVKLTKNLTKILVPDCTPEKSGREYYLSAAAYKEEKQIPEWDIARFSPSSELISSQRKLEEITENLRDTRIQQSANRQELDNEWENLQDEENQLRTAFIKFNQFVKDNLEKRERADRKIQEGKVIYNRKKHELEALKQELQFYSEARENLQKQVTLYKIYEDYLESVCAATLDFQSIYDISTRFDILVSTRAELAAKQVKDLEEMEKLRNVMTHLDEDKQQMLMGLNNEMAELDTEYDETKQKSLYWETVLGRIKNISVKKKTEIAEVKTSCWNLYSNMKKNNPSMTEKSQDDIEGQLQEIKEAMLILTKVVKEVKRRIAYNSMISVQNNTSRQPQEQRKMITPADLLAIEEAEEKKRIKGKERMEAKKKLEDAKKKADEVKYQKQEEAKLKKGGRDVQKPMKRN